MYISYCNESMVLKINVNVRNTVWQTNVWTYWYQTNRVFVFLIHCELRIILGSIRIAMAVVYKTTSRGLFVGFKTLKAQCGSKYK